MEFEIEITARTSDEGGIKGSIERQLAEFGGEATLLKQEGPYRVDSSGTYWFEVRQTYTITL